MSGRCEICERKPLYGNHSNFSQKRTRRRFVLNVHRRRLPINGVERNVNICTRCPFFFAKPLTITNRAGILMNE